MLVKERNNENGACCGHCGRAGEHREMLISTKHMTSRSSYQMRDQAMGGQMSKSNVASGVVRRRIVTE